MWRAAAFLSVPVGILATCPAVTTPRPARRRRPPDMRGLAAALPLLTAVAGCGLFGGDGPEEAAQAFAAAWSRRRRPRPRPR